MRRRYPASLALTFVLTCWGQHDVGPGVVVRAAMPPAQNQAAAEAGAREALQKYSAALQSLDAQAVKKVQPSVPVENLMKAFQDMRELKVDIDAVRVLSVDGPTTRVSCRVTQTLTPKAGARQRTAVTRVVRL